MKRRPVDSTDWLAQAAAAFVDRNTKRKAAELAARKSACTEGAFAEAVLFARAAQGEAFEELCEAADHLRALRSARAAKAEVPPPPEPPPAAPEAA